MADWSSSLRMAYGVIDGSLTQDIERQKREVQEQLRTVNRGQAKIAGLTDADDKRRATELVEKAAQAANAARQEVNKSIAAHNEIVEWLRKYTLGVYRGQTVGLAGLGVGPLIAAPVVVGAAKAALWASAAIVAMSFAFDLMRSSFGSASQNLQYSKGYMEQFKDIVSESGVVISKTAWGIIGIVTAFAIYRFLNPPSERTRTETSYRVRLPAVRFSGPRIERELKQVPGEMFG